MNTRTRAAARLVLPAATAMALAAGCASGGDGQAGGAEAGSTGRLIQATGPGGHQLRQVPASGAPTVRLRARPDPHGGWNLHLLTTGFQFTPQHVNQQVRPDEGHAHLYIDGEKHTRIYSPWFFLPASAVPAGRHTLTVTLNANDHTTWAVRGHAISAKAEVAAARGSGHGRNHEHGNEARTRGARRDSAAAGPVDTTVRVAVNGGQVSPPPHRV